MSTHHSKSIHETRLPGVEILRRRIVRAENAMKAHGYLAHGEKEGEREGVDATATVRLPVKKD